MKNNLFNKALMKKYSKDKLFKLNVSKHDFIKRHIEMVENGEFKSEVSSYLYFYDFLRKVLDYKREENIIFEDPEAIGRGRVEFTLKSNDSKFMIIELKNQDTDLDKPQNRINDKRTPIDQAFDYAQHSDINNPIDWVMVSNFKEFRLYNYTKRSGKCICFNYDDLLNKEKFKNFMVAFSLKSHVKYDYPDKLLKETIIIEKQLETNFYKLFHETRLMLIKELEELNEFNRIDAVHYAQLILNRYMFISFAEDTGLLTSQITTDTIVTPIKKGNLRHNSIWQRLNELFLDINEGNKYKDIPAYNGGLFEEDLEFIKIRDTVENQEIFKDVWQDYNFDIYEKDTQHLLEPYGDEVNPIYKNLLTISSFDFSSELDVNILGHIFENSIGDLEELKADVKGRRKEEGIFYTYEYITDYICRNTIIPYLSKSGNINTVEELIGEYSWSSSEMDKLDKKLKKIKIVDPACGSGAFLNKAADVLLEIHKAIYDYNKGIDKSTEMRVGKGKRRRTETVKHFDLGTIVFDSISKRREILLNNIFGVDLNEESVEITKLSLFLKVCKKGLKLPNLDNNIKSGNSLIDNPKYADRPFDWGEGFQEIFANGGFDIVIGNPPYVGERKHKNTFRPIKVEGFGKKYYKGQMDLFYYFYHRALDIVKNEGMISLITTNYFITADGAIKLRKDLKNRSIILKSINFNELKIFEDAKGQHNLILVLKKANDENYPIESIITNRTGMCNKKMMKIILGGKDPQTEYYSFKQKDLYEGDEFYMRLNGSYTDTNNDKKDYTNLILEKIKDNNELLGSICHVKAGIGVTVSKIKQTYLENYPELKLKKGQGVFVVSPKESENLEAVIIKDFVKNSNIEHYSYVKNRDKLIYLTWNDDIENYPNTKLHLSQFKKILIDQGLSYEETFPWYALNRPRTKDLFEDNNKIILPYRSDLNKFAYSNEPIYGSRDVIFIREKNNKFMMKYLLVLLNSKLYYFWLYHRGKRKGKKLELYPNSLKKIPIKELSIKSQQTFIERADEMLKHHIDLQYEIYSFKDWLMRTFKIEKLSQKLDKYYELNLDGFLEEVRKKKVDVKSRENYKILKTEFKKSLQIINPLLQEIELKNKEIDKMVYYLYDLKDEEIKIVEKV